jgi:hypothetical protein
MTVAAHDDECSPPTVVRYEARNALADRRSASGPGPVFDQWLTHHLGRLYDPIAQEPIPSELLRLLELRLK